MAGMKGVNSFLVARYIVFGLFTICNAITCSVAVWNYSLVRSTEPARVDVYLIFIGAFSLLSIFTLIFVELLRTNALTTRVWFECAWVALFWIMQLAGGAALIAIESDITCSLGITTFLNSLCISEHVLLAFTWLCTFMLLVYLLTLVLIAASQHRGEPNVWVSDVRGLRAAAIRQFSSDTPNSPFTNRFKIRSSVDTYTPHIARCPPDQNIPLPRRAGPSVDYEIEPFPIHPVFVTPEQMDIPHSSDLPEAIPLPPPAAAIIPSFTKPMLDLPTDTRNAPPLSLGQVDMPRELVSTIEYANPGLPSSPVSSQSHSLPSASLLGDWPRRDVMQLPAKPRRKPPPSTFEFPKRHIVTTDRAHIPVDAVTQPRSRRPSGPRRRVPSGESGHRPAPLDLLGISNYEAGRRDDPALNV